MSACRVCDGSAAVAAPGTAAPAIDACWQCALGGRVDWDKWKGIEAMQRFEHAPAGDAGTVTMAAIRVGGRLVLEVVAYAAVLRAVPWYRGGMGVTTLVAPYADGVLDIERAGVDAPYRLRARMSNRVEKLPPVQLRVPALATMAEAEHAPVPVVFRTYPALLRLTLPAWARRTPLPRVLDAVEGA